MSREDIVAIASRLFAVYLLVISFRFFAGLFQAGALNGFGAAGLVALVLVAVAPLLVAALLWFFPLSIASQLLPVMRSRPEPLKASAVQVQEIAFSVLGLWILATALSDATYWVAATIQWSSLPADVATGYWDDKAAMFATFVEILIGAWLVIGSRKLADLLHRFRYGS
jgi:hypothetical protein